MLKNPYHVKFMIIAMNLLFTGFDPEAETMLYHEYKKDPGARIISKPLVSLPGRKMDCLAVCSRMCLCTTVAMSSKSCDLHAIDVLNFVSQPDPKWNIYYKKTLF